jgi:hypothetical protein
MKQTATQVLEEQLMERASRAIADEIDFEVLSSMLVQTGWTRVQLSRPPRTITSDINTWMHAECKKHWKHRGKIWIFENKEEAALFKLTWS